MKYSILVEYYDMHNRNQTFTASFIKEILLSYRILFGDDKRSRKLYRRVERWRACAKAGIEREPTLDQLCGLEVLERLHGGYFRSYSGLIQRGDRLPNIWPTTTIIAGLHVRAETRQAQDALG
ncbi:hypothetical protein BDZ45DRAFT_807397 [Acephala macrosclerotiorum]|nr:hypothetical protein BDZ45DRAFT_807397 [Acephala macrosclerotiorum]